ncbi:MAG TPA: CbiQ family ECF transporter T component [Bryobacteraceae bacterium]|nr:CbiQ family ECF transporter T component [Bryobacteraceae bacterium]
MRQPASTRWSNQKSIIHRLDARTKLILLLSFLLSIALLRAPSGLQLTCCLLALIAIAAAARLPVLRVLRASLLVVPFVGLFSLLVYLTGDALRAWSILAKSYLSTFSVLIFISVTPMPKLLAAARFFRIPALLIEVTQLIYRYLFVLSGEARIMQTAFRARAGQRGSRAIRAASGMVAVLFTRSYEKAAMIHKAMCSRGFSHSFIPIELPRFNLQEGAIVCAGIALLIGLHFV